MNHRADHFEYAHAGGGHANTPTRVPFVELVEPFMSVGEEIVRGASAVVSTTARMNGAFKRWRNVRATVLALRQLEDHRLEDIGVHREDIVAVARKLAND